MAELVKNQDVLLNLVTDHLISTLEKKTSKITY